jgi:hypothetical protein
LLLALVVLGQRAKQLQLPQHRIATLTVHHQSLFAKCAGSRQRPQGDASVKPTVGPAAGLPCPTAGGAARDAGQAASRRPPGCPGDPRCGSTWIRHARIRVSRAAVQVDDRRGGGWAALMLITIGSLAATCSRRACGAPRFAPGCAAAESTISEGPGEARQDVAGRRVAQDLTNRRRPAAATCRVRPSWRRVAGGRRQRACKRQGSRCDVWMILAKGSPAGRLSAWTRGRHLLAGRLCLKGQSPAAPPLPSCCCSGRR